MNPAIVMPAFNEAATVGEVVRAVRAACPYPVFVVDDASTDDTGAVATAAGATVLPLAANLGAWGATQTGLRYALRRGHDLVVTVDADGQHEPQHIDTLVRTVTGGTGEVAIGACIDRVSGLRRFAGRLMTATAALRIEDVTSGFRAYGPHALRALCHWRASFLEYQDVGVLSLLAARGFTVIEVPVTMMPRRYGPSRIFRSWSVVAAYMYHSLLLGLAKRRLRQAPASAEGAESLEGAEQAA